MSNMDQIDIQVSTSVSSANAELDKLIVKLGAVQKSLSSVGGKSINFGSNIKVQSSAATTGFSNMRSSMDKTTKSTMSLAVAFGTLYANFFWVIRGIKDLWNSIDSTADYMESYNYFNVAFNKIANDWSSDFEKYGYENGNAYAKSFTGRMNNVFSKLSGIEFDHENMRLTSNEVKNLGLNIKEVTQHAAQLGSVTNSVGLSGESSLAASTTFTKLAGDLSSLYNVDYSSASTNLQSGLIGQSRALYKYGIDITNATLQTYAYELGLEKAVSEMTQAEKMQLRMIAILDQSRVAWGNLANEIDQPSNQIRLFKNNLSEAAQILGQLFIPILSKVMPVINGITIAIKKLLSNIAGIMGIELKFGSSQATDELADSYEDVSSSIDDVASSAKNAKTHLLGIDELNVIEPQTESSGASSSAGGASGGIDLTDDILNAAAEYQKAWDEAYAQMESKAQAFADKLSVIFVPIEKLFSDIKIGDWFAVGEDVSDIVTGIFNFFSKAIASVNWQQLGENIGLFLLGIDWKEILDSFGELFWKSITAVIELWKGAFETAPIETAIIAGILGLKFTGLGPALKERLSEVIVSAISTITLPNILFSISSLGFSVVGSPSLDVIGAQILALIEDGIEILLPDWAEKLLGNIVAGITVGAVGGSWIPGLGTFAGAVVGGIIGALNGIEIDGKSILSNIAKKLFNFDVAKTWLDMAKKSFKTAFDGNRRDWLDMGSYIFEGIVEGLLGAITYITEPFTNLFWWIWDGICGVFGIHSPAEEMKPIGKYILLGILNGFTGEFGEIKKALEKFLGCFSDVKTNIQEWCSDTAKDFSDWESSTVGIIEDWKEELWDKFNKWETNVSSMLENWRIGTEEKFSLWKFDVSATVDSWKSIIENKFTVWKSNSISNIENWRISTEEKFNLWKSHVENTMESWKSVAENKFSTWKTNVTSYIRDWYENVIKKFSDFKTNTQNTVNEWFDKVSSFFGLDKWSFSGIKDGLVASFNSAINAIKNIWNTFANWLNSKLTWTIDPVKVSGVTLFEGTTIELGKIPTFEVGGFPEDGLFFANHNELVGKFTNGRTAVANNEQIIEGIKYGVREAVTEALAPYLADIVQNTRETANKDLSVNIGDRDIARANIRGKHSLGFQLITES